MGVHEMARIGPLGFSTTVRYFLSITERRTIERNLINIGLPKPLVLGKPSYQNMSYF